MAAENNPFSLIQDSPYVSLRMGLPLDEMRSTGEALQKRWELNKQDADLLDSSLGSVAMAVNEKDRPVIDAYNKQVAERLSEMAKRGDYHNMTREISKLGTDFAIRTKPAVEQNAEIQKDIAAIRANSKLNADYKEKIIKDIQSGYAGMRFDENGIPMEKTYKSRTYADSVDANMKALQLVSQWKAANTGITEQDVRAGLTKAFNNAADLLDYKNSVMGIHQRELEGQLRAGKITKDQMAQQMKQAEADFQNNIINPAIENAVHSTAYENTLKDDSNGSGGGYASLFSPGSMLGANNSKGVQIKSADSKSLIQNLNDAKFRLEQIKGKTGFEAEEKQLKLKMGQIERTMSDLEEKTYNPETSKKIAKSYDMFQQLQGGLTRDEFDRAITMALMDHPEENPTPSLRKYYYMLGKKDMIVKPETEWAFKQAVRAKQDEWNTYLKDNAIAADFPIITGMTGDKDVDTWIGERNKAFNKDWQETSTNYTVGIGGRDAKEFLSKEYPDRDPSRDQINMTGAILDGKAYMQLKVYDTKGKELGDEFIAPKNQDVYMGELQTAAVSMMRNSNPAIRKEGERLLENTAFTPMIQNAGFRVYSEGTLDYETTGADGKKYDVKYKLIDGSIGKGTYGLFKVDAEGNETPMKYQGDEIKFKDTNSFAHALALISTKPKSK
jgi:hypothetical protein